MRLSLRRLFAVMCTVLLPSCSAESISRTSADSVLGSEPIDDAAELASIVGDERVGRALVTQALAVPSTLGAFEALLEIGRACPRTDSREIFVIEEPSTRLGGHQRETEGLLPRAVVGGCNETLSSSLRQSFEVFMAVVSDTAQRVTDPLSLSPVELMALDETTGLYNFYIIEKGTAAERGTVTRIVRGQDGTIEEWKKEAGASATKQASTDARCFHCHVSGGPVMNELSNPWQGWVSTRRNYSQSVDGESRALVSESRALSREHTRASLANDLEQITRKALATWVEGTPGVVGSGFGPQTLSGAQPGGLPALLRSVFCETEVNFAGAFDTIPFELFVEPTVAVLAGLDKPLSLVGSNFPALLPVRAEADRRIEVFLQKRGLLSPNAVLAVRLLDDENDVFSQTRCALHGEVVTRLAASSSPDQAVRSAVLDSLPPRATDSSARNAFIRALLDETAVPSERTDAEAAYLEEFRTRYQRETNKLTTASGFEQLRERVTGRQAKARSMFPTDAHPLPMMHRVPQIPPPFAAPSNETQ